MLSGLKIKEEVEKGNIVITDFDESRLNPNSYNIRLGNKMRIYTNGIVNADQIEAEIREKSEPQRQLYFDICSKFKDEDSLTPDALKSKTEQLEEVYKELTDIKNDVIRKYALDPKKDNKTEELTIPEEGRVLLPGVLYLGETMEYTETYGYVPKIDGRSTTGRLGIIVHITAGFGDNGFKGKWTLEITVTHPVIVYPGMEIGQLYYETIDGDSSMLYDGKYQNQQGVQAAKVD